MGALKAAPILLAVCLWYRCCRWCLFFPHSFSISLAFFRRIFRGRIQIFVVESRLHSHTIWNLIGLYDETQRDPIQQKKSNKPPPSLYAQSKAKKFIDHDIHQQTLLNYPQCINVCVCVCILDGERISSENICFIHVYYDCNNFRYGFSSPVYVALSVVFCCCRCRRRCCYCYLVCLLIKP